MDKEVFRARGDLPGEAARQRQTRHSTWVSIGVNAVLVFVQVLAGVLSHSQALVADGLHSLSDLVCDFIVLLAARHSRHPADSGHPYGHGRFETAASLALGLVLAGTGVLIILGAAARLQALEGAPPVAPLALAVALLALLAKEALFRYMLRVGERLASPMLVANAWHARSDAASSLVVALGVGGNLAGFPFADAVAAVIVGFMIARMGSVFGWDALQELIDAGLETERVAAIRQVIVDTSGVTGVHALRTRRMANRALVDAHVQVDPRISVSEGHRIAESVRGRVLRAHPDVLDVLVHIDPEDDLDPDVGARRLPGRDVLLADLAVDLEGLPAPRRVLFHYLGGCVEAEVFYSAQQIAQAGGLDAVQERASGRAEAQGKFSRIVICTVSAP